MDESTNTNDNRYLEYGCLDPDRHYIADYMEKVMAHFAECEFHPDTVCDGLMGGMAKLLQSDPESGTAGESALRFDFLLLWGVRKWSSDLIKLRRKALFCIEQRRNADRSEAESIG